MKISKVQIKTPARRTSYDITIGSQLLAGAGDWAASRIGEARRVLIVSNRKVFDLYGKTVERSFRRTGFATSVHLIGDGERFKNLRTLEGTLRTLGENGFARTDAVVALGGGVVGDLAGFAASIYLRGVPFLQIPSTLLAMIDSSVGGKTGINTSFGKNLTGSFCQPRGVLIDVSTLGTLARRELTAGFCEAIKQGAIGGRRLLGQTSELLEHLGPNSLNDSTFLDSLSALIEAQVKFKARIVQNDEIERPGNSSPTSRKILNFGHTFGHALEKVTDYKHLKHGEAVGHGIIFAARLSKMLELLGHDEVDLLHDVVHRAGTLPAISHIVPSEVLKAFKHDKKKVGDSLQWILLRGIGKPVIVSDNEIPLSALTATLKAAIRK